MSRFVSEYRVKDKSCLLYFHLVEERKEEACMVH